MHNQNVCIKLCAKINGTIGEDFDTSVGTKQGCPLSPTIFGLFIEQFGEMIEQMYPHIGPKIGANTNVPAVFYADDMSLLAEGEPLDLQLLLNALSLFCKLFDLEVNVDKTYIVIFQPKGGKLPNKFKNFKWTYEGEQLPVVQEFTYLGNVLHRTQDFKYTSNQLAGPGNRSMHSLVTQCRKKHLNIPVLMCRLFDILVRPVLSYNAQIWGPDVFLHVNKTRTLDALNNKLEVIQCSFLRIITGACKRVNNWVLLKEFGRYPLQLSWLLQSFRFWNKLCSMPNERITKIAFVDSIQLFVEGSQQCWPFKVLSSACILDLIDSDIEHMTIHDILDIRFSIPEAKARGQQYFDSIWSNIAINPRLAPSTEVLFSTSKAWTWNDLDMSNQSPAEHLSSYMPYPLRQLLLRFRLGGHNLQVEEGRMSKHNTLREQRVCQCCTKNLVEDALHFMLECPAYDNIRDRSSGFFRDHENSLPNILNTKDVPTLCSIVQEMMLHRKALRPVQKMRKLKIGKKGRNLIRLL